MKRSHHSFMKHARECCWTGKDSRSLCRRVDTPWGLGSLLWRLEVVVSLEQEVEPSESRGPFQPGIRPFVTPARPPSSPGPDGHLRQEPACSPGLATTSKSGAVGGLGRGLPCAVCVPGSCQGPKGAPWTLSAEVLTPGPQRGRLGDRPLKR